MKARIMKNKNPKILACGFGEEMLAALSGLAGELGIKLAAVSHNCGGEYVGWLADLPGFSRRGGEEKSEGQCLIFVSLSEKELDAALNGLRRLNLNIPLKAVLTPSNSKMTLSRLIAELEKEHKALHG